MKVTLLVDRSVEENAGVYYDKAKKTAKKIEGAREALEKARKKLEVLEKRQEKELEQVREKKARKQRKKEWFEKFRWFTTSDGFLVIGGRDATTNEVIIKKHTDKHDLVFHTDMAGSPFFVLKTEGKEASEQAIKETADATCSFSKAWQLGLSNTPVFYVKPEQVSKKARAGEYLTKGAFMIHGDTEYVDNQANCAIGMLEDGKLMAGPVEAVKAHAKDIVVLVQGDGKVSDAAKKIQRRLGGTPDEIIRALPTGGIRLKK